MTALEFTHYIPLATSAFALWFVPQLLIRWHNRRPAPHLAWWALGVALYGLGTVTESLTTLIGWHPGLFRLWYISGALLGGAPLAQGTAYLLLKRRTADLLSLVLVTIVVVAGTCALLSPINLAAVEPHRLTGKVLVWSWVRAFSPFINTYAFLMLVGGAIYSAFHFLGDEAHRGKVYGNIAIAVGGLLPGIGGTFTRFGHVEVLYVTEFLGLTLIYLGYRLNTASPRHLLPLPQTDG